MSEPISVASLQWRINREFMAIYGQRATLEAMTELEKLHKKHVAITYTQMLGILKRKSLIAQRYLIAYKMFERFIALCNDASKQKETGEGSQAAST